MLLKRTDDRSADVAALNAFLTRNDLSNRQRADIRKEIDNTVTGYRGEQQAAYFLDDALLDAENTILIHDLRIEHGGRSAQIDHLLLTRFRWAYVVETKNLSADLSCNENGEWTAWYGKKPIAIPSPIEQARRHVDLLGAWLKERDAGVRQIEPVVVVSSSTYVGGKRAHGDELIPIIRADLFKRWWQNQRVTASTLNILWAAATAWSTEQFAAVAQSLVDAHQPKSFDWEVKFGLDVKTPPQSMPSRSAPTFEQRSVGSERPSESRMPVTPLTIATRFGSISIRQVGDGRLALRHEPNPELAKGVSTCVEGVGRWQARFKNWLIEPQNLAQTVARLRAM